MFGKNYFGKTYFSGSYFGPAGIIFVQGFRDIIKFTLYIAKKIGFTVER